MKFYTFIFSFFLTVNFSYAQLSYSRGFSNANETSGPSPSVRYENRLVKAIEASDDLKWQQADLSINGSVKPVTARYNVFEGIIEIKANDKIYRLKRDGDLSIRFIDSDLTYQAKSYIGDDGNTYTSYFIIDDYTYNYNILTRSNYELTPIKKRKKYHNTLLSREIKLEKNKVYYLLDNDKLFLLTTKNRAIKKMFPKEASQIKTFIKENKLSNESLEDLTILANYITDLRSKNNI
ncbi:hypothetical protein [Winogradskyella immobilis]|uniref:Uncharacterized protein n=1 Tax=Winogradskyella immobilis TaxID=2816852 RepID=A0ABS8EPW6_9FLAO|nr:hypothetical protein [Winogradskyella immobilis]MCC1485266.1 hypothetical protein [Winogradskyella immobilis]MCG0017358.1 hypothetical protein [Winogradskyella immobilis]